MLFTPETIPVQTIVNQINAFKSIKNVHHVHVWQLNEDEVHLEAHIDFHEDITLSQFDVILQDIEALVFKNYDINHVNIQPEFGKDDAKEVIVQD
jgi:cobalt-zinc-cadmium efflux system protein